MKPAERKHDISKKTLKRKIEYFILTLVCRFIWCLPYKGVVAFSKILGNIGYYVLIPLRNVSIYNLKLALKINTKEAKKISRRAFCNMALTFLETAYYKNQNKILEPYRLEGLEHIYKSLEKGKGVILLTAHMGNWEFMARYISDHNIKLAAIGRRIHNPYVDEWIVKARKQTGMVTLYKSSEVSENRKMINCVKQNYAVLLLADQYLTDGIKVPFFGVETKTATGPARIAMLTGAPIHFAVNIRSGKKYKLIFSEQIKLSDNPDRKEKIKEDTAICNKQIEAGIRENPDQWLSFHNRFKDYRREQKKKSRNL